MNPIVQKYLPSPSFQKKIGVLLACIVGIFLIHTGVNYYKTYKATHDEDGNKILSSLVVSELIQQDRDGDSIPDWEEGLWGTSPDKADTNDDGISDGEEIARKKVDLKSESESQSGAGSELEPKLNETEQFARELFAAAATLGQAGELSEEGAQNLAESVSARIEQINTGELYTIENIKRIEDSSTEAVLNYDRKLKLILGKYPPEKDTSLQIVNDVMKLNDATKLKELDPIYASYSSLISELLTLKAPAPVAEIHLKILNAFANARNNVKAMKGILENPIVGLSVMLQFQKNTTMLQDISKQYESIMTPYYIDQRSSL